MKSVGYGNVAIRSEYDLLFRRDKAAKNATRVKHSAITNKEDAKQLFNFCGARP